MNKQKLIIAGINYDEGLARFMDNVAMYEKYLKLFVKDDNFANAKAALVKKDYTEFYTCIHTIKGVAGNLSITNLYNKSHEMVVIYREGKYELLDEMFADFSIIYD